jgi:hypothetical protein
MQVAYRAACPSPSGLRGDVLAIEEVEWFSSFKSCSIAGLLRSSLAANNGCVNAD